jgi:uncharacterized cupin superfamily protein
MRTTPIRAQDVDAVKGQTIYPEPFARVVAGRTKRKLGDVFGLQNFGVNLTHLEPGSASALLHAHTVQDEFVYIIEGTAAVVIGDHEFQLSSGECVGFKAGSQAHQILNRSNATVTYLEIGDRLRGDEVIYPNDDIAVRSAASGGWVVTRKDGSSF